MEQIQKKKANTAAAVAAAAEAHRRARLEREAQGIYKPVYMRMTLTEDAYNATKDMDSKTFRKVVSAAIRKAAAEKGMAA